MNKSPETLRHEAALFFRSIDAAALREDLIELFLRYTIARHTMLPPEFERMGERFCVFIDFLKDIDNLKKEFE
jgi:hypothetical protein